MENECSHNWAQFNFGSCGLWGQAHKWVEPGQSLSLPYSAHRELPRGTGGPPGDTGVHCGGKDTETWGHRKILSLLSFFCFILFCCFIIIISFSFILLFFFRSVIYFLSVLVFLFHYLDYYYYFSLFLIFFFLIIFICLFYYVSFALYFFFF